MADDLIDLTPLDPDADPGAEDRFVGAVMSRIAARANPYPVRVDALWGVWSLARPVLVAASIAIAVAGVLLARATRDASRGPLTVAESLGVPPEFQGAIVTPSSAPGGRSR
jgi:hypothetical protein